MSTFNWFQFGLALASQIIPAISQAEAEHGPGKGPSKLNHVLSWAALGAQLAGASLQQVAQLKQSLPSVINEKVAELNASGVLPKPSQP